MKTEGAAEERDWHLEGHHCKLVGGKCQCRCHEDYRHGYNPKAADRWSSRYDAFYDSFDKKCGPRTATACATF